VLFIEDAVLFEGLDFQGLLWVYTNAMILRTDRFVFIILNINIPDRGFMDNLKLAQTPILSALITCKEI